MKIMKTEGSLPDNMQQISPLLPILRALSSSPHRHPSVTQGCNMLDFQLSNQPNLRLLSTRAPLSSAMDTLLATRYSSILSWCSNYLATLWSIQYANSLSVSGHIRTSFYFCHSYHTSQMLHHENSRTSLCNSHTPWLSPIQSHWLV